MASKQVIVMRRDLKMTENKRYGKAIAQGSHAVLGVILKRMRGNFDIENFNPEIKNGKYSLVLDVEVGSPLDEWLRGSFTKVALGVDSEEELMEIYDKALKNNLPVQLVTDNGLTRFHGVRTKTCLAIGPADSEEIDKITGHLSLI